MGDFAGWGKLRSVLSQVGGFAGIPWGTQGQCCLTPRGYSLGYTRSVLSNTKWEILQVFPGVNKVSCCLTPSGRFCRYSLGVNKVSVF